MGKITEIRNSKRSKKRVNIYVDGRFALALTTELLIKNKLKVGRELTEEKKSELLGKDIIEKAMDIALRYLGYRPRSEAEIRTKLLGRGLTEEVTEAIITRLRDRGLIDDFAFAHFWKDNRESFNPRSTWLTRRELKQKGVSEEVLNQVIDTETDEASAYQAALLKARRLTTEDYNVFRKRLGEYLQRRGFGYGVINKTIAKIWQDLNSA